MYAPRCPLATPLSKDNHGWWEISVERLLAKEELVETIQEGEESQAAEISSTIGQSNSAKTRRNEIRTEISTPRCD
jgi:hypothetical protein